METNACFECNSIESQNCAIMYFVLLFIPFYEKILHQLRNKNPYKVLRQKLHVHKVSKEIKNGEWHSIVKLIMAL